MTLLPAEVRAGVEAALGERAGRRVGIGREAAVGGGCIHHATRVETTAGDVAFVKWSRRGDAPGGIFAAEAAALAALRSADAVRVPAVLAVHDDADSSCLWLLLEWLEPGRAERSSWERLGRGLAALHRARADRRVAHRWGAVEDNFIGTLPQENDASDDWPAFWRDRRLLPQLRRAYDAGHFDAGARRRFDTLLAGLDALLDPAEADGPSLLHGDLWAGNVHMLAGGEPALIDPASYHGHREVDLAMAELFGGFDRAFHDAYDEAWPVQPGYAAARRAVYQLYYLLVHVNLFGAGYVDGTLGALARAGF